MNPTPEERSEYEQLRRQIEEGFARITRRIDHIAGAHSSTADGDCPTCEARPHPQA